MARTYNILVTGSKGFVGVNICNSNLNNKYNLITDNHNDDPHDISKPEYFTIFKDKIDIIIHLAAKTSIKDSLTDLMKHIVKILSVL